MRELTSEAGFSRCRRLDRLPRRLPVIRRPPSQKPPRGPSLPWSGQSRNLELRGRVSGRSPISNLHFHLRHRDCKASNLRRARRLSLALLFGVVGSLSLTVAPAAALQTHIFKSTFAGSGSEALSNPSDVAVDNSTGPSAHDLYVTDPAHHRVEKFSPSGTFILMFGKDVNETTGGNICPEHPGDVCKAGIEASSPAAFTDPVFDAVDNSASGEGDVYVGDLGDNIVSKFDSSGNLIKTWGSNGQISGTAGIQGIAVDPHGNLFVETGAISWYEPNGTLHSTFEYPRGTSPSGLAIDAESHLYKIDGTPEVSKFTESDENLGEPDTTPSTSGLTIDPSSNDLYTTQGGAYVNHYALNCGQACTPLDSFGNEDLIGAQGLGIDGTTGTMYVANTGAGDVAMFTAVIIPDVTTGATFNLTPKSVTASGTLEPAGGGEVTSCEVEYVTETFFQAHGYAGAPTQNCTPSPPYNAKEEVKADLTGLTADTIYHYRLAVGNSEGTNHGQDLTFTTPEAVAFVTTLPATTIEKGAATLNGSYQGEGLDTTYHFEYGLENCATSTCTVIPIPDADNGTGTGLQKVIPVTINGLQGGTTYHYRLVATNEEGTGVGQDETFETSAAVTSLTTKPATNLTPTSVSLNGSFVGDGNDTTYYFQYGVEPGVYGQTTKPERDAGSPSGPTPTSVEPIEISGLVGHHTYYFRIVATNIYGTTYGQEESVLTPSAPTLGGVSSEEVTANSATLTAKVNPENADTTCQFEYGDTPSYGTVVPCPEPQPLTGIADLPVKLKITGLTTKTYHFRVVAENAYGKVVSEDQSFSFYPELCPNEHLRQESHSERLPDCRAYELVTPEQQGSFILFPGSAPAASFATNPARFSYGGGLGSIPGTNPPAGIEIDNYIATRTDSGWVSTYAGVGGETTLAAGGMVGDLGFDKVIDFNEPNECFGCTTEPEPKAPYVWSVDGQSLGRWPADVETNPLLKEADLNSHGTWQTSPDFSHLAFSSNNYKWGEGGLTVAPGSAYDYDTAAGTTALISLLPGGEPIPQQSGQTNSGEWINFPGDSVYSYLGGFGEPAQVHPGVSTDGSHILMSTSGPNGGVELFMRIGDTITREVSTGHDVNYLGMTADGSKVFFTSEEQLTPEDHDHSTDLYMWSEAGELEGRPLTLLSLGNNGAGNGDACAPAAGWTNNCNIVPIEPAEAGKGDSPIAEESGDIYFYSPEQLDGSKGLPNQQNLYLIRDGQVQFVSTFSPGGFCETGEGGCSNGPVGRINVSPTGEHMAFMTNQQLTGYQNNGYAEMYSFTPATDKLVCVSCDPSGASPVGSASASDQGLFMANDGRTFFYTPDALVPKDTNELHDVYEYVEGRPQLISAGTGAQDTQYAPNQERTVGLEGVSADGVNVYFSTFDTLVGQDRNGEFAKVYDARTNGGFPFPPETLPCEAADECHGAGSSPPESATLGSTAELGNGGNWPASTSHKGKKHRPKRHRLKRHKQIRKRDRSAGASVNGR